MVNVTVLMEPIELMVFVVYVNQINFTILLINLVNNAHKIVLNVQIKLCVDNVHNILD